MVIHIIITCDRKVSIEFTNDNITYDIYHLLVTTEGNFIVIGRS